MVTLSSNRFWSLIFSSFIIVSLGLPSLSPILCIGASLFGYALFWRAVVSFSPQRRFWLGVVWFSGVQGIQLNWLSATEYMGPFIVVVYLFVLFGLGIQFGFLSRLIRLPLSWMQCAAIAGFWVLMEWSRLFVLTGFTWNPIGLSLAGNSISIQFASLLGIYGLCFWCIWVNLIALRAFLEPKQPRKWVAWAVFAVLPFLYGFLQKMMTEPESEKEMAIALVQTGILPEQRDRQKKDWNAYIHPLLQWKRILSFITEGKREHFDMIVLPEGSMPGGARRPMFSFESARSLWVDHFGPESESDFPPMTYPFAKEMKGKWFVTNSFWIQSLANHFGAEVVIGLDDIGEEGKYNAAFHYKPRNLSMERYEKRVLIPGGEYIPFGGPKWISDFLALHFGIEDSFDAGSHLKLFEGQVPIGILICLEETYSSLAREARMAGAKLLVNITNDVWFPKTRLPWSHFDHARLRAVENGICLIRACNTGVTSAIDCFGEPIALFPVSETAAGVLTVQLPVRLFPTLYSKFGDVPILFLSGTFASIWTFVRMRTKKKLP